MTLIGFKSMPWISIVIVMAFVSRADAAKPEPGANKPTKKLALLVGVNKYVDAAIPQLHGAVNDTRLMHELLSKDYDFAANDIVVLKDETATRDAILKSFQDHLIAKADADTVAVFHFSGHGSQVKDADHDEGTNDNWDETIVPHDSGRAAGKENRDILDDELGGLFERREKRLPISRLSLIAAIRER